MRTPLQEQIIITKSLSPKGRALCQDGKIEVPGALAEEKIVVTVGKKRKKLRHGHLKQVLIPSLDRVLPKCKHVPDCGGCTWQHMHYSKQLEYKQKAIEKLFSPLIQEGQGELSFILACENIWQYRNKMEFSFSQNRAQDKFLGLIQVNSQGKVLNVEECYLASPWFTQALEEVRQWWEASTLLAYHHVKDVGHLRTLTLREAKLGKGKMAILTVSGNPEFAVKKTDLLRLVEVLCKTAPKEELSIFVQVQQIAKGRPTQFFEMLLNGKDHITEQLQIELKGKTFPLSFKISPTSFFQPNSVQAQKLYTEALNMVNLQGATVFDLYCGCATIGLAAAKLAKEVVGIEVNPHCVFDATWNKKVNQIENFRIYQGDVATVLAEKKAELPIPDIVIVDPARSGLNQAAIAQIVQLNPKEILYISCCPKTQAADIQLLLERGYILKKVQPIDQFPHTVHIENICLLQRA